MGWSVDESAATAVAAGAPPRGALLDRSAGPGGSVGSRSSHAAVPPPGSRAGGSPALMDGACTATAAVRGPDDATSGTALEARSAVGWAIAAGDVGISPDL